MIAVPGETPRSPLITVNPVLVTVVAPRTPKVAADPRLSCALIRPGKARPQAISAWHFILNTLDVVDVRRLLSRVRINRKIALRSNKGFHA